MTTLTQNSFPHERLRGCVWSDDFISAGQVVRNHGALVGSPQINFGVTLDGTTDYIDYTLTNEWNAPTCLSVIEEFIPHSAYDEDAQRHLFSAGQNYWIAKTANIESNTLYVRCGGTNIAHIPSATYSPYWYVNQRNVITLVTTTGDTSVWLNGQLILDADATAYTPSPETTLLIAAGCGLSDMFDGTINHFKVFNVLLTPQEVRDYANLYAGGV